LQSSRALGLRPAELAVVVVGGKVLPSASVVPDVNEDVVSRIIRDPPPDEIREHLGIPAIHSLHGLKRLERLLLDPVAGRLVLLGVELNEDVHTSGRADLLHLLQIVPSRALEIVVPRHVDEPRPARGSAHWFSSFSDNPVFRISSPRW